MGQSRDDPRAPSRLLLAFGDHTAHIPVKQNHLLVGGERRLDLGGADAALEAHEGQASCGAPHVLHFTPHISHLRNRLFIDVNECIDLMGHLRGG